MNDSKNEKVMIPDWMLSQEAYTPSKDKEAFLSKSIKISFVGTCKAAVS